MKLLSMASLLAVLATGALPAQALAGVDPDEFVHLEPVLQRALEHASPFVVTIETFGGTRSDAGKAGPMDGDGPPKPRPKPVVKPKAAPESRPLPQPESLPAPPPPPAPEAWPEPVPPDAAPAPAPAPKGDGADEDDENKKKKKLILTAPGFQQTQGKTTGVILTADGWVLVSRFALNLDPTTILVDVPGRGTFHAQRAGEDTSRGIALVKIDAEGLPVPRFVDPAEARVGQWAFALGRTFASELPTVHIGIVSARRRLFGRALQIDAYTSPANYGGAVVDAQGDVLGIAVPLSPSGRNAGVEWYDSGIGFATTIADIRPLLERMKNGEILQRGWLGVQLETAWLGPGAKISGTPKDGLAAQEGIRKGDIILKIDGTAVLNGPHLQMLLSSKLGGDFVSLEVQDNHTGEKRRYGPLALLNTPWSEQKQGSEEVPASFEVPEGEGGR
ncbi:MAG: trypsin-like peptidase domain-containing protein [Planctomycetes bacterium]|nr:trypsin-like peptidase domain-containing protein [Planctomycetota bacterium]